MHITTAGATTAAGNFGGMGNSPQSQGCGFFISKRARIGFNQRMGKLEKQLDRFLRKQPRLGKSVYLASTAAVLGDVKLGDHSSVCDHADWPGGTNRIVVGHHSTIKDKAVL